LAPYQPGKDALFTAFPAGKALCMNVRRSIQKRIRHRSHGVNVAGDLSAAVSANVNEPGSKKAVSSHTRSRIVQRPGRTEVFEERDTTRGGADEPVGGSEPKG
jgi:hypothetical protein